jgi:hypothetical protein
VLVLLVLVVILGAVSYYALWIELPNTVREVPVEIDLDW